MDIELFNKQLAIKVAKAKSLEQRGDLKNAIDAWLEVSDMSLKYSKTRGLDSSFRNMLIKRTENIVEHIKKLKVNLVEPERIIEEQQFIEEEFDDQELGRTVQETEDIRKSQHDNTYSDEELKNIQEEIVEIKASKDFKIITPHEELDMNIFKDNKTVILTDEDDSSFNKEISEQQEINKNLICFACGYDRNPPNAKTCKNCNVELK